MFSGDYIQHRVMHMLHRHAHIPSALVLNKVDLVERRDDLLPLVRVLTKDRVGGEAVAMRPVKPFGRLGVPDRLAVHVSMADPSKV